MAPIFFTDLLKNLGKPKEAMFGMILGTFINILLDYILIIRFDLELVGAAIATLSGQFCAFLFLYLFARKFPVWKLKLKKIKGSILAFFNIIKTGFTSFLMQLTTLLLLVVHNRLFLHFGNELYVSSFGIIGYAFSAYWLIVNGFVGGTQPILSHNYIKESNNRVRKTLKMTLLFVLIFSTIYSLLFYIFPEQITSIFSQHNSELFNITRTGFRLVMFALPFAGFNVVTTIYFQAIGKNKISIFLAVSRVIFFMIPFILLLPKLLGVNGIYLIIPLSEVFASVISLFFIRYNLKHDIKYIRIK